MALTDNLSHYYKFDESSGNAAATVGGITLTNSGVTYASGKINNGAQLGTSGGNSNTLYNTSPGSGWFGLAAGTAKSIGFWWMVNSTPVDFVNRFFDLRRSASTSGELTANYQTDAGSLTLSFYCNGNFLKYVNTFSLSTWYYITVTCDASNNAKMYVNASQVATATWGSFGTASNFIQIGNANGSTTGGFGGPFSIDELGLWQSELTSGEVSSLYNGGAGLAYPFTGTPVASSFMMMGVGS